MELEGELDSARICCPFVHINIRISGNRTIYWIGGVGEEGVHNVRYTDNERIIRGGDKRSNIVNIDTVVDISCEIIDPANFIYLFLLHETLLKTLIE